MKLNERALLVKLSLSMPGNSRKDASITAETILRHAMQGKAGRWLKQIFPDEAIEPLTKLTGEIRTWHYEHTLPWTDEGYRILPSAMHAEYTDAMRTFRSRYEAARDVFLSKLDQWVSWARQAHNGTFDASLYQSHKLAKKFGFECDFNPVPCSGDFRVAIDDETAKALDERVALAELQAQSDLWTRLADPLRAMVDRLGNPDAIFRDSLISNVRDIVALIPKLDLQHDAKLAAFAMEASALATAEPETLRTSKSTRADTAKRAAEILERMSGYLQPMDEAA